MRLIANSTSDQLRHLSRNSALEMIPVAMTSAKHPGYNFAIWSWSQAGSDLDGRSSTRMVAFMTLGSSPTGSAMGGTPYHDFTTSSAAWTAAGESNGHRGMTCG